MEETKGEKEPKKKQATSASYTLKAFAANIAKLEELGLIEKKDKETLEVIKDKAITKYVKEQFK